MKNMKKLFAILVAALMIVASMSALAAAGDLNVNGNLKVTGLDEGDTVKYYQILKWKDSEGWEWGTGVNASGLDATTTVAKIAGDKDGSGQITGEIASDLAAHLGAEMTNPAGSVSGTQWTATGVPAGLYMVIVTPAKSGTIYNPIFVAANFYGNGEAPDSSNEFGVVVNQKSYYDEAMAKKSTIPLDKTSKGDSDTSNALNDTDPYCADVGEVVDFEVTTTVPKFGENYTHPVFKLKDTLSTGLVLDQNSITVTKADGTELPADSYTIGNKSASGYTVTFTENYLWGKTTPAIPATGQDVKITYKAEVTSAATKIINQEKNDVDLYFSNTPTDETGKGLLRDETNHFTFSIDANLLGQGQENESSNEAIKVGLDKEGNPIVEEKSYAISSTTHAALAGAEFELWKGGSIYKNDLYPEGVKVTSDDWGRITIKGLDVGEYELKETKAPAGYIKLQDSVPVKIEATIKQNVEVVDTVDAADGTPVQVTYTTNELESYKVTVGGSETTYTIINESAETKTTTRNIESSDKELVNTKGTELPSTGGMGTTLFYIGGAVLVLGAVVVMITRRRVRG